MQKEQRLGRKVFYYYLSHKIVAGIFLLIISIICLYLKNPILVKILFFLPKQTAIGVVSLLISASFIVSFGLLLGGFLVSWAKYVSCTFVLGENSISIKRGIFNKKEIAIPYRQIQNVNTEQTFSYRVMGVCKLILQTAGHDEENNEGESDGIFNLIEEKTAYEIRDYVLERNNNTTENNIPQA